MKYINWALFLAEKSMFGFWEIGEQRLGSISLVTCCNLGLDFMVILGQYEIKRFEFYEFFQFLASLLTLMNDWNDQMWKSYCEEKGGLVFIV